MKKLTLILLLLVNVAFAQTLSPDSKKVKNAYEKLNLNLKDKSAQAKYIFAFPSNASSFLAVFNPKKFDQLYKESDKYIEALNSCATKYPDEVISKSINIGKDLVWDADAVSYLQKVCVSLALKHPNNFVKNYNSLKLAEQNSLVKFYADVENHNAYLIYQQLIDKLKKIGQVNLSKKFEAARELRKKLNDH